MSALLFFLGVGATISLKYVGNQMQKWSAPLLTWMEKPLWAGEQGMCAPDTNNRSEWWTCRGLSHCKKKSSNPLQSISTFHISVYKVIQQFCLLCFEITMAAVLKNFLKKFYIFHPFVFCRKLLSFYLLSRKKNSFVAGPKSWDGIKAKITWAPWSLGLNSHCNASLLTAAQCSREVGNERSLKLSIHYVWGLQFNTDFLCASHKEQ